MSEVATYRNKKNKKMKIKHVISIIVLSSVFASYFLGIFMGVSELFHICGVIGSISTLVLMIFLILIMQNTSSSISVLEKNMKEFRKPLNLILLTYVLMWFCVPLDHKVSHGDQISMEYILICMFVSVFIAYILTYIKLPKGS